MIERRETRSVTGNAIFKMAVSIRLLEDQVRDVRLSNLFHWRQMETQDIRSKR